ncbi:Receptor expression-enhancing protein 2 [Basidiobolus ranarum]|uniref:Protein YOP1 n=1 Tax=Basidiobolus ranarum TaxID=34480 RepID=A0ABR2WZQ6_9FUNG
MYTLAKFLCLSIGLYRSYKAVKSRRRTALIQWVTFWIVMVTYRLVEAVCDLLLEWWLPLYTYIKLLLVGFLLITQPWGAETLYKQFLQPFMKRHKKDIENLKDNYTTYLIRYTKELGKIIIYMVNLTLSILCQMKDLCYRKFTSGMNASSLNTPERFHLHTELQSTPSKVRKPRSLKKTSEDQ